MSTRISRLLIANRGEIAIRIARAAAGCNIASIAVHASDDAKSLHVRAADEAVALAGVGAAAYLDIEGLIAAAKASGADAIHPGYGFLSESAAFARRAAEEGIVFVGPRPELLELFGDKAKARALAIEAGVPLLAGTTGAASLEEIQAFFRAQQEAHGGGAAIMIKAIAGGGGRGMRAVTRFEDIEDAWRRCQSEAKSAFGDDSVYVERYLPNVRHIEVQVVGDGVDVIHLGERECTIQRRNQKIVEIAPSPTLSPAMRAAVCDAAIRMAQRVGYAGLGTFEFLVPGDAAPDSTDFAFMEVNPRVQVEHTVTEEVYGVDLVEAQLRIAGGARLADLGLTAGMQPRGYAIQLRINMETITPEGEARPSGGRLDAFDPPSGPGVRVDTFGYVGYVTSPRYDSLLAKLIVHSRAPDYTEAVRRALRALREFRIEGVATNMPFLRALLAHPKFIANAVSTRFLEQHIAELVGPDVAVQGDLFHKGAGGAAGGRGKIRSSKEFDPLAVFSGAGPEPVADAAAEPGDAMDAPEGMAAVSAPLQGTIVSIDIAPGAEVRKGQPLLVLEAMKMEHVVAAPEAGVVAQVLVSAGDTVFEGHPLAFFTPGQVDGGEAAIEEEIDLDHIRPDLAEALERHAILYDDRRPDAVARRRKTNQRTVRENIADLVDDGSFVEYGGLALAAQRQRRSFDELLKMSPADGMVTGLGSVNGALFDEDAARCAVMGYDYTVFAGTQGVINHRKKDRLLELSAKWKLPMVVFAEGGGGRPGDEWPTPAGLDTTTFTRFGQLSGLVPTVAVVDGRCFAGNAAVAGACDVIIATGNANIGMGGPAMIEGGGLGVFRPEDVGPVSVQAPNGVIDLVVKDEAEGVAAAKKYLGYFQGRTRDWSCADQRLLRRAIPENRLRAYDIRQVIATLADADSVLELRAGFGKAMVTALVRFEGRPMGVIANNSQVLGGAIDSDAADKAARFVQLCDAFDIPLLSLCDTPGMMVGPEVERTAQVRHVSRMFVAAANATIPMFTVVLRKGYGLGALAMAGGGGHSSFFTLAWPTGEFGAMGLEGGVKLAYRKEMMAIADPAERKAWFDAMVAAEYEKNRALSGATFLEVDDVIDPVDTRRWIMRGLRSLPAVAPRAGKKRPSVDVW